MTKLFSFQLIKLVGVTTLSLFVRLCKAHYHNFILNEFGINSTFGKPTYTPTVLSKDEILQNHRSVLDTFKIPTSGMNEFELPYLYWIPTLHKILRSIDT